MKRNWKLLENIYLLIRESTGRNVLTSSSEYDCVLVTTGLSVAIGCSDDEIDYKHDRLQRWEKKKTKQTCILDGISKTLIKSVQKAMLLSNEV